MSGKTSEPIISWPVVTVGREYQEQGRTTWREFSAVL